MALEGGRYGDGAGGSAAAVALSTVAGLGGRDFEQITITADDDNTGDIYIGKATVAANGSAGAIQRLKAGKSWTVAPARPFQIDPTALFVRGSDGNQTAWVTVVTGGSRAQR